MESHGKLNIIQAAAVNFGEISPVLTDAALQVRGLLSNGTSKILSFQSSTGVERALMYDDGRFFTGSGIGLIEIANFQQVHATKFGNYGVGFYSYDHNSAGVTYQGQGSTPVELSVSNQGSAGSKTALEASCVSSAPSTNRAGYFKARDGSSVCEALKAHVVGGGSIASSTGKKAFVAVNESSVPSSEKVGAEIIVKENSNTVVYTGDQAALKVSAQGSTNVGSTNKSHAIIASAANSTVESVAILVPAILAGVQEGNVVLGADQSTANNSMLEVTGDAELVGNSSRLIMTKPDGGRVSLTVDNSNTLIITPL